MQRIFITLFFLLSCHSTFSSEQLAQKVISINGKEVPCIVISRDKTQQELALLKENSPTSPITPIGYDKDRNLICVVSTASKSE